MSGQGPKRFRRAQVVAMLNMLDEEDSGKGDTEDQEKIVTGSYQFRKKT